MDEEELIEPLYYENMHLAKPGLLGGSLWGLNQASKLYNRHLNEKLRQQRRQNAIAMLPKELQAYGDIMMDDPKAASVILKALELNKKPSGAGSGKTLPSPEIAKKAAESYEKNYNKLTELQNFTKNELPDIYKKLEYYKNDPPAWYNSIGSKFYQGFLSDSQRQAQQALSQLVSLKNKLSGQTTGQNTAHKLENTYYEIGGTDINNLDIDLIRKAIENTITSAQQTALSEMERAKLILETENQNSPYFNTDQFKTDFLAGLRSQNSATAPKAEVSEVKRLPKKKHTLADTKLELRQLK